jgi:hypothetical protein
VFGSFNSGMNIELQLKGVFGCSVRHMWLEHTVLSSPILMLVVYEFALKSVYCISSVFS